MHFLKSSAMDRIIRCLRDKILYPQHNCDGDTKVYYLDSELFRGLKHEA